MRFRPLGKTGLTASELALGTWGLSGEAYGPVEAADQEKVVRRSLDMGFSLFETAEAYGGGAMEALLGKTLGRRTDVTVVTKLGIDRSTQPATKHFDPPYLCDAAKRSLRRIGRERIDVCLLHNPQPETLVDDGASEALEAMKKEGTIGCWGVSAGDADVARAAIQRGAQVIELAYNLFNSVDLHRLAGELIVAGTGVLARSTLSYGLLAGLWAKGRSFAEGDQRAERWTKPELERRLEQLDAVRFLVKGEVLTLRGAAVRYVLANHLVCAAVLGPRSVEQLEQLVRETGSGPTYLPDADLAALPRALSRVGIAT